MKLPVLMLLLLCLVLFLAMVAKDRAGAPGGRWPFYARRLMSKPEQVLFHRLAGALPDHLVLAQVQVSRVLGVEKGNNFHQWNNRIKTVYDDVQRTKMLLANTGGKRLTYSRAS